MSFRRVPKSLRLKGHIGKYIYCGVMEIITITPKFTKGDNVRVITSRKIGTVNEVLFRNNNVGYRVTVEGKMISFQEKFLEPFTNKEQEIIDSLLLNDFDSFEDFKVFNTWIRLKKPYEGNYYSYLGS
jgi:predicted SPOUT superfamily RNA methylase MTH1